MKKKAFLIVCTAAMLAPTIAWAQYPQLTDEAKETYKKMITEERRRSDEAWAKALPIVEKEAREGRPVRMIFLKPVFPLFPGLRVGECSLPVAVAAR